MEINYSEPYWQTIGRLLGEAGNAISTPLGDEISRLFWPRVPIRPDDGCWEWGRKIGSKKNTYGSVSLAAHRISYVLHSGHIPKGARVRHSCDNRGCVNPDHLLAGTDKDNAKDQLLRHGPLEEEVSRLFWIHAYELSPEVCWEWTGTKSDSGYGRFNPRAHRISYLLQRGPIPKGLYIRHTCDNKGCVNPDHLITGTGQENTRDFMLRHEHHLAKINFDIADQIRAMPGARSELAKKFGLCPASISNIKNNKAWVRP